MKKFFVIVASVFLLFSCEEKQDQKSLLPESNGKINNVSVVIDENLWSGEIGDSIRKKFAAPVDALPQEESYNFV